MGIRRIKELIISKRIKVKVKNNFYFRTPALSRPDGRGEFIFLPGWQVRASGKHPVGVFSEQPDRRGGQFRHPLQKAEFFIKD